ncbi:MAG TPA: nuclear transport factor 2 family protein [Pyrinomonadaceae bacterium]
MRRMLTVVVVACALCAQVAGQEPAKKSKRQAQVEQELMQLERDIGEANVRRDKAFFERVEADEFLFTDAGGGLTTKREDVASLDQPPGEFRLVSYVPDEMKVYVYDETAVVFGRVTTRSRSSKDGREVTNQSRFTDVFVRRAGRWQIVAGHSSRIRQPAPATQ